MVTEEVSSRTIAAVERRKPKTSTITITGTDDREPLYGVDTKRVRENRFEQLKRRCFAEIPSPNNTFARMKKNLNFRKIALGKQRKQQPVEDEDACNKEIHIDIPQAKPNEMNSLQKSLSCENLYDDNIMLFTDENQNRHEKYFTVNRAADFMKRRTNFLRKRNIRALKRRDVEKQIQQQQQSQNDNLDRKLENFGDDDKYTAPQKTSDDRMSVEINKIDDKNDTREIHIDIPQAKQNEMNSLQKSLSCENLYDDNIMLFTDENQNRHEKHFTVNRAADFMKRRTNFLRKRNIRALKRRDVEKQIQQQQQNDNLDRKLENFGDDDKYTAPQKTSDGNMSVEINKIDNKNDMTHSKRFLWKNTRKRVRYVVRLIRRESMITDADDDDETMLMDEQEPEFPDSCPSPYCFRTLSAEHVNHDDNKETPINFHALSFKYLSPKGHKLDRFANFTPPSSGRSSRRGSFDSNANNSDTFLSSKYLNKSSSLDSVKPIENEHNNFEQSCFSDDFEPEESLNCLQNNLYNAAESDGDVSDNITERGTFEVADEEIESIIEDEVNSYMSADKQSEQLKKYRRSSSIFHFESNGDSGLSNIKHTTALSYSVNDLYDLFDKDQFVNFEASFDDLVV